MKHTYTLDGWGVRLRPVAIEDAAFINALRRSPHAVGAIGDTDADITKQVRWLETYFERGGDYYFCIEAPIGHTVGTIGLYDIQGNEGDSGRWIITPGIPAAPGSILLLYSFAFGTLNLNALHFDVVRENTKVVSFHKKYGATMIGISSGARSIGGKQVDMVDFVIKREDWPTVRANLEGPASIGQRLLAHL